ncbi:MAG TPA: ElyC/SanA/YdcF family protein [Methyloceanibacter sp.]|nr:ElyC/SanA/YdcF family protein [Methyloceanibacter sp.]
MSEEEEEKPGRFSGFFGGVRLIFDGMLFLMVLFFIGFAVFATGVEREPRETVPGADGITVLTGGADRIDQAMKLLAQGKAKRVLITGVYRATTKEELKQLASQGDQYFACCVDIDKEARNTIDNATETSEWVAQQHFHSVIVVTSNYHMPRALAELGRAMPDVVLIAYPVIDKNVHLDRWWTYPGTTKLLMSEYLKYLPALGRLGATRLANLLLAGENKVAESAPEP